MNAFTLLEDSDSFIMNHSTIKGEKPRVIFSSVQNSQKLVRILLCVLFILLLFQQTIFAETRHALVIGNSDYDDLGMLRNPTNDATDVARVLSNLGFTVQTLIDADLLSMENAIVKFGQNLSMETDSVGFFFYAGHGVQYNGTNYLIPSGAKIASEVFLKSRSISAQAVLDTMQAAGNHLNVVVLDACRDNPFMWARSGQRGLSIVSSQPPGSIIAYATSAGSVAGDGTGRNGIFTGELLKMLQVPGLDISEMFRRTGYAVKNATEGRQLPAIYSQFFDTKVFLENDTNKSINSESPIQANPFTSHKPLDQNYNNVKEAAEIFITSNPVEADITINEISKGKTPIYLSDMKSGDILQIHAHLGTMSVTKEYRVQVGFNELLLVLEQEKGNLFVQSSEGEADVYVDGVYRGKAKTGLFKDVDAGKRIIELHVSGKKAVHEVVIEKDSTAHLVPIFIGLSYQVYFDPQGGSLSDFSMKQVSYQNTYGLLPEPSRKGYSFLGWWTAQNGKGLQIFPNTVFSQTNSQRLYASWKPLRNIVRFDSQGGEPVTPSSMQVLYGETYDNLPISNREGYAFNGWWTEPEGSGIHITNKTIVDLPYEHTLFAYWLPPHAVEFDTSGGSVISPMTGIEHGTVIPIPENPTKKGYAFDGWYKDPDFLYKWNFEKDVVDSDMTLYANWNVSFLTSMTFVQGGTVEMKSSERDDYSYWYRASVENFYIGTFEVTQSLYEKVMGKNPSRWKHPQLPVERVSWYDAVTFCNALSKMNALEEVYIIDGKTVSCNWDAIGYRLPSEIEWVFAAKGGDVSRGYLYSGSNYLRQVAWYKENSGNKTHTVGSLQPNELGMYDMSGNVEEWCWLNATGDLGHDTTSGLYQVSRGGSWNNDSSDIQINYRDENPTAAKNFKIGFRVVVPMPHAKGHGVNGFDSKDSDEGTSELKESFAALLDSIIID